MIVSILQDVIEIKHLRYTGFIGNATAVLS